MRNYCASILIGRMRCSASRASSNALTAKNAVTDLQRIMGNICSESDGVGAFKSILKGKNTVFISYSVSLMEASWIGRAV